MKNKEAFDALVSKISVQENPTREDILQAVSYLSDCELAQVYAVVKEQIKKEQIKKE